MKPKKTLEEIEMTKLDKCYLIIYALKTKITLKTEETIGNKDLYIMIGLNSQGSRKYLGSYIDDKSNHRYWIDIFESLKTKGMEDVIFLACDDNTYLKKCAKVAYPYINTMPLLLEITESFYKYFSDKFSTKIRTEIKKIYTSKTYEEYRNNYDLFIEKYKDNSIIKSLIDKYLSGIETIYKYDQNIRNALFNNYFLMVLKNKIDRINRDSGYLNDKDDIINLTIDYINTIETNKTYTKKEWLMILESFYNLFSERIEVYL